MDGRQHRPRGRCGGLSRPRLPVAGPGAEHDRHAVGIGAARALGGAWRELCAKRLDPAAGDHRQVLPDHRHRCVQRGGRGLRAQQHRRVGGADRCHVARGGHDFNRCRADGHRLYGQRHGDSADGPHERCGQRRAGGECAGEGDDPRQRAGPFHRRHHRCRGQLCGGLQAAARRGRALRHRCGLCRDRRLHGARQLHADRHERVGAGPAHHGHQRDAAGRQLHAEEPERCAADRAQGQSRRRGRQLRLFHLAGRRAGCQRRDHRVLQAGGPRRDRRAAGQPRHADHFKRRGRGGAHRPGPGRDTADAQVGGLAGLSGAGHAGRAPDAGVFRRHEPGCGRHRRDRHHPAQRTLDVARQPGSDR